MTTLFVEPHIIIEMLIFLRKYRNSFLDLIYSGFECQAFSNYLMGRTFVQINKFV